MNGRGPIPAHHPRAKRPGCSAAERAFSEPFTARVPSFDSKATRAPMPWSQANACETPAFPVGIHETP